MKQVMAIGTVVLAMAAGPAYAQQAAAHQEHKEQGAKAAGKAASDQQFAMTAAKASMAEVELGKLAQDKASSPEVKKFAQRMVDDHSKANDELKTLAQNKNITLPTAPDATHKAHMDRMSKMSGEAFDRGYMQDMLKDHRKAVELFRMEANSGKDPDMKAWAAKTLPTIEEHLKMAQDANKAVGTSGKK